MNALSIAAKCFLITLTLDKVIALTIRQRYIDNGYPPPGEKCKILSSGLLERSGEQAPIYGDFYNSMVSWIQKANCSVVSFEYKSTGLPDTNGTYDGFVGAIQRNEANSAIAVIRPDSLPFEPGIIGSTLFAADAVILSKKKLKVQQTRDVMSVFVDVGRLMYIYTAYVLLLTAILITVGWKMCKCKESFVCCMAQSLYELFWILFGVYHPSGANKSLVSRRILLEATSLFGLAFIIGFLQNRVGSDLCVFFGEEDIQSLDDLLTDPKVRPWVSPRFFLYNILQSSKNGTKTNLLWQRIMQNPNKSIEQKYEDQASIAISVREITSEISAGRMATLIAAPITWASRQFGCRFNRDLVANTTIAPETFAPGHLTTLWSHQTSKYFIRAVNYLFTTTTECGLWQGALTVSRTGDILGAPPINTAAILCQEGIIDNRLEWEPFRLKLYIGIFGLIESGWFLGFFFIVLEKLFEIYNLDRRCKLARRKAIKLFGFGKLTRSNKGHRNIHLKLAAMGQSLFIAEAKKVIEMKGKLRRGLSRENSLKFYSQSFES